MESIMVPSNKQPKQEIIDSTYPETGELDDLSEVEKLIKDAEDIILQSLTLCATIFPEKQRIDRSVQEESTHVSRSVDKSKPHEGSTSDAQSQPQEGSTSVDQSQPHDGSTSVDQSRLVQESAQDEPSRPVEEIIQAESSRSAQQPDSIQDPVESLMNFSSNFEILDYALDHATNLLDSYSASEIDFDSLLLFGSYNTTRESISSAPVTATNNTPRDDDDVVFVSAGVASPRSAVVDLCTPINKRNRRRSNRCLTSNNDASVILIDDISPSPAKQQTRTSLKTKPTPVPKVIASTKAAVTPTKTPKPDIICSVCMDSVMNNQPATTICGHIFCLKCITTSIQFNKKCPLCNRSLNKKNYHRIYF